MTNTVIVHCISNQKWLTNVIVLSVIIILCSQIIIFIQELMKMQYWLQQGL